MASNATSAQLPSLPSYTLTPRPFLISGVPDIVLQLVAPIIAYWVVSIFFHILDEYELFSQYRLHTPAELLKRNHVSKYEVVRDVVVQQVIQTFTGLGFAWFDGPEMTGRDSYDVAVWALRLRKLQTHVPQLLAILGVDALKLASRISQSYPSVAGVLTGGVYNASEFLTWEVNVAKVLYWVAVPLIQFIIAVLFVDTWQYFLHRAMHMNKFLYTTLHARHHRLYVPYAFGALYNHPIEGFMLDTLGTGLAYLLTGMTIRQGMWFFTCSTIKTVDDHCGYAFPWDPLQHVTSNNAAYHDIHHQSWGVKSNFSQPFFTFWDRFLGTTWTGGDVSARYERGRVAAQKKVDAGGNSKDASVTNAPLTDALKAQKQAEASQQQVLDQNLDSPEQVFREEAREEAEIVQQQQQTARQRGTRRRQSNFDAKSLSDKVSGSLYGRGTPILHADGGH